MFDGSRLKEIRIQNGLTQKETAKKFNISPSTLNRYERNDRIPPTDFLIEFSIVFNVSLSWLANHPEASNIADEIDTYGNTTEPPYNNPCYFVLSKNNWSSLTQENLDRLKHFAEYLLHIQSEK